MFNKTVQKFLSLIYPSRKIPQLLLHRSSQLHRQDRIIIGRPLLIWFGDFETFIRANHKLLTVFHFQFSHDLSEKCWSKCYGLLDTIINTLEFRLTVRVRRSSAAKKPPNRNWPCPTSNCITSKRNNKNFISPSTEPAIIEILINPGDPEMKNQDVFSNHIGWESFQVSC